MQLSHTRTVPADAKGKQVSSSASVGGSLCWMYGRELHPDSFIKFPDVFRLSHGQPPIDLHQWIELRPGDYKGGDGSRSSGILDQLPCTSPASAHHFSQVAAPEFHSLFH